ncbi:hypothetical protein CAPTEDRAFT_58986, partial [Capitella teleta]
ITQHAILSGHSFIHKFTAQPVGTHWYHSHYFNQRLDGIFGMFIVHDAPPVQPYFVLSVMDWYHGYAGPSDTLSSQDGVPISSLKYVSGLINGRGRYNEERFPLSDFMLVPGEENVFRMCHTGAEFPYEISIDEHLLSISTMGANLIVPMQADFLFIYPGECYDFNILAKSGTFWLRA